MAQTMHPGKPGVGGRALVHTKLLNVTSICRDQGAVSDTSPYPVEQISLGLGANRDSPTLPSLGPGGLEEDVIPLIRKPGSELDRLLPA